MNGIWQTNREHQIGTFGTVQMRSSVLCLPLHGQELLFTVLNCTIAEFFKPSLRPGKCVIMVAGFDA